MSLITPFSSVYSQLFPSPPIHAFHYTDTGPDDALAAASLFAANVNNDQSTTGKVISLIGSISSFGVSVRTQSCFNSLRIVQLANPQYPNVWQGAQAPIVIENDPNALQAYKEAINRTQFYGKDGLEDVGGWPSVTVQLRPERGYTFVANTLSGPVYPPVGTALISTSPLTEVYKTLQQIIASGSRDSLVNAIFVDPGAPLSINGTATPNGANIMMDIVAAQNVFSYAQARHIPIVYCPPELIQKLLFSTTEQPAALRAVNNTVTNKLAEVTEIIPHLEKGRFPNASYPVPAAVLAEAFLDPDLFTVQAVSASIGADGDLVIDSNAPKKLQTVYVLDIAPEKKEQFYKKIIERLKNFNPGTPSNLDKDRDYVTQVVVTVLASLGGAGLLILGAAGICAVKRRIQRLGYNNLDTSL